MGAVYADDGTYLGGFWPTWDAHHFAIENKHRSSHTAESWAALIADPDWNEHAREDLRNERVCDGCYITVARGLGTGGHGAKLKAQAELTRRGVSWRSDAPNDAA